MLEDTITIRLYKPQELEICEGKTRTNKELLYQDNGELMNPADWGVHHICGFRWLVSRPGLLKDDDPRDMI